MLKKTLCALFLALLLLLRLTWPELPGWLRQLLGGSRDCFSLVRVFGADIAGQSWEDDLLAVFTHST